MTTDYRRPVDAESLAHNFRVFAEADCAHEPLYAALSHAIADDDEVLALLMQAPYAQRRPVFLFAAVHDLLLAGHAHAVGRFYRTVAPHGSADVAAAGGTFRNFCRAHRDALLALLGERSTQTNEIGRSAVLRLALGLLPADPIALVDVGCSAGLNLLVDRFRFAYALADGRSLSVGPDDGVRVPSAIVAGSPSVTDPIPPIARRIGVDRAPLAVDDPRDARWLRAYVWPSDDERHARLAGALAVARAAPLDLRCGDANETLVDVLGALDPNLRPVVFHSWVVSYFDHDARRRFAELMRAMVVDRDGAWISAEGPKVVPGLAPPPLPDDADAVRREATIWHLTTRVDGVATSRAIARSHPHGRWIDWLVS